MTPSLFAFSALPLYLAAPSGYTDALSVYAGKTGFPVLRDRFGFLNQFSPYRLYEPHLPLYGTDSTERLADIMDARAAEIIRRARSEGQELFLFLSGGVDSTAMACAILRAAGGNMHGLHAVYTRYSVREYPAFFAFLRGLVDMMEVQPGRALDDAQARAMEQGYAVTGWCADQLFGSQINHDYPDWYFRDWRGWVGFGDAVQQLEAAFAHYGLPVKTFGEFAWFMNFACKYDIVRHQDVRAVAMESPDSAVVQPGDAELPLTSLEFVRLSEATIQTMLNRYLR